MKKILALCLLLSAFAATYAQSFMLRGVVVDETDEPYIGVTVQLKNTTIGVITNVDGKFEIRIPDLKANNVLVFKFVGTETQEYVVDGKKNDIKIVLKEDRKALDEVTVIGYGTTKKSSFTGAATSVKSSDKKKSSKSTNKALEGKVAGVSVSSSESSESSIRIRGASSISTDAVPSSPPAMAKDASATAIYGSRASSTEYAISEADFSGINSGTLTSGEVSDFAKWDQWENILTKDFSSYLNRWKYRPLDRYMVQLTNMQGMPVPNAEVTLQNEFGSILWKARTDNTGKAELWSNLFDLEKTDSDSKLKLIFDYEGKKAEITNASPFSKGINTAKIDADCSSFNAVDIFFMVDATGSMADEIRYLQIELSDIIQRVKKDQEKLQLRMGSLVYRDHGDEYLTRKSSLDSDISSTIQFLKGQSAAGGGDYPEAVDEALYQAIADENWNNDALARIAFLVLDAPSHDSKEVIDRIAEQIRSAAEKGIRIVPIVCSGMQKDGEYLMRCLALATNGTYIFLTDDSGVGNPHIKPTTDKYDVEKLNDAIVRIIKQYTQMPDCKNNQWDQDMKKEEETDKFVPNPYDEKPDEEDVSKLETKDIVKVYPNPCRDILKVDVKKEVQDVYFVDMAGKSLLRFKPKKDETIEANVQSLASGIYFVKAYYKGKWFAEKVIVKAD